MDSAFMDSFNALLDPVNAVADSTPGFPAPDAEPCRSA